MGFHIILFAVVSYVQLIESKEKHYYIAAVDVEWDYAPNGNLVSTNNENFPKSFGQQSDRIGSKYRKVIYRGYTDSTFTTRSSVPEWQGLLGPTICAEVGDTVIIKFRNLASIGNFSMHPHGLFYDKASEGKALKYIWTREENSLNDTLVFWKVCALYVDGTDDSLKKDDSVPPGGTVTYVWNSTVLHAPTSDDENCVAWAYHSHENGPKDVNTGLIGFIINCRAGILGPDDRRMDVDREFPIYVDSTDENDNHFIDQNLEKCGDPVVCKDLKQNGDIAFRNSNYISHINGFVYGNLPPFVAREGETVVWYIMSLNSGLHTMHVNGQTMVIEKKRVDTVTLIPATFFSGIMKPINPGRWLIYCRNQRHFTGGMQAFLTVERNPTSRLPGRSLKYRNRISRVYYIAIEEIFWDYAPNLDSETLADAANFVQRGDQRIGSIYKKAVYRQYTDVSFTRRKTRAACEAHHGLAGPPIKAEAGQKVMVVVLNRATRPYSLLLNGVSISKRNEGAYYKKNPTSTQESGAIVFPRTIRKYIFSVPEDYLLSLNDACTTFVYHSAVDLDKDIHSGLFGPLLVCKPGTLTFANKQAGVDREFILNWMVIDENLSWYIDKNIKMFTTTAVDKENGGFQLSNKLRAINGYSFGSLPGLNMCLGERVKWHMYGLGETFDHHHFSFEGNNFLHNGKKVNSGSVFPGSGETVTMIPDQAGRLLLRNGQLGYESEGMYAFYNVHVSDKESMGNLLPPRILPSPSGITRRYYVGIIELDWDYAPLKRDAKGADLLDPNNPGNIFVRSGTMFVGTKYKKAVYRQYTDESFTSMIPRSSEDKHLGIMGPIFNGNAGDVIEFVLNNMATVPFNLVPRNVVFKDGSPISSALPTLPGETKEYSFVIPERSSPLPNQPNCIGTIYSSRVDPLIDTHTGLFGAFVICKPGTLDALGRRTDGVTKEFAIGFSHLDENFSHYKKFNFAEYAPDRIDFPDSAFRRSNVYHSVNGYIYDNLEGLVFLEGEMTAWYIFVLGSTSDLHAIHFHGQLFKHASSLTLTRDVINLYPDIYETVEMSGYNPGTWSLHCHVGSHSKNGMITRYTVLLRDVGTFAEWKTWSNCSESCGGGIQTRTRDCQIPSYVQHGDSCTNVGKEQRPCNEDACPATFGEWLMWTDCSETCGGIQTRERVCQDPPVLPEGDFCDSNLSFEERLCGAPCPPTFGEWLMWSDCSDTCGGIQTRERVCQDPPVLPEGDLCDSNPSLERRPCGAPCPPTFGEWQMWSDCSDTCGGIQTRERVCQDPPGLPGGDFCDSNLSFEERLCGAPCPPTLGEWQMWSDCSETCGGIQTRERVCQDPPGLPGGDFCDSNLSFEERLCGAPCPP